ncbi:methyl-accepting chemotaxis protein [uncultured Treponema sp.]|uniref:methyl-accepting chemotaxis protein n=1 Tax=uncultured Treponema sp. TaxID=162155 RepID=UPI0015C08127|nr:methyl-accepting chemotaxis protein [uncultured Treponema sp.]
MNKKTIAFLTRSLVDATGRNMWKGILSGCQKDQTPLITFRGPVLNKGQGSMIYHLLTDSSVSGIISWASSDVDQATSDFYKKFEKTPLVCMTFKIEGKPVIITDCKTGQIELIDHLIDVHHFTKIAFIRGPQTHVYAKERYEGYIEGLKKHGIQPDQNLISDCGGWAIADGAKAVTAWLGKGLKPGKDIQAIVAVGDNVAIGAQEELLRRGYSIPQDIAVCGFNGTDDAACSTPPITSVEMPFYGQGLQSYNILKAILTNNPYEKQLSYKTRLVLGESCGCTSESVKKACMKDTGSTLNLSQNSKKLFFKAKDSPLAGAFSHTLSEKISSQNWQNAVSQKLEATVKNDRYSKEETSNFFQDFLPLFVKNFAKDLQSKDSGNLFLATLSSGLNSFQKISQEFSVWQDTLSVLRAMTLSEANTHSPLYKKTENLFQQARILVNEFDCRSQKQTKLLNTRKETTLRQISTEILFCSDFDRLFEVISKSLPRLSISGCYLVLYNDCRYTEENKEIPQTSRLVLAITHGEKLTLPEGGLTFKTTEILPDKICGNNVFAVYTLESLHYQNTYLGYIVFESEEENGSVYETLRDQISGAIYSSLLLEERTKSRIFMESTMHTMSEKADVVSSQSESITGSITTISGAMESVAGSIKNISDNIANVTDTVTSASQMINEADNSIQTLIHITEEITRAIELINDIAEKTNVLALNAAIEAAHAGDAGRGFSVVAKEVKALAAQTVSSTTKIQELVKRNNLSTKQAKDVISSTNRAIKTITALSESIKTSISEQVNSSADISNRLQDASTGIEQITAAITEIANLGLNLK